MVLVALSTTHPQPPHHSPYLPSKNGPFYFFIVNWLFSDNSRSHSREAFNFFLFLPPLSLLRFILFSPVFFLLFYLCYLPWLERPQDLSPLFDAPCLRWHPVPSYPFITSPIRVPAAFLRLLPLPPPTSLPNPSDNKHNSFPGRRGRSHGKFGGWELDRHLLGRPTPFPLFKT